MSNNNNFNEFMNKMRTISPDLLNQYVYSDIKDENVIENKDPTFKNDNDESNENKFDTNENKRNDEKNENDENNDKNENIEDNIFQNNENIANERTELVPYFSFFHDFETKFYEEKFPEFSSFSLGIMTKNHNYIAFIESNSVNIQNIQNISIERLVIEQKNLPTFVKFFGNSEKNLCAIIDSFGNTVVHSISKQSDKLEINTLFTFTTENETEEKNWRLHWHSESLLCIFCSSLFKIFDIENNSLIWEYQSESLNISELQSLDQNTFICLYSQGQFAFFSISEKQQLIVFDSERNSYFSFCSLEKQKEILTVSSLGELSLWSCKNLIFTCIDSYLFEGKVLCSSDSQNKYIFVFNNKILTIFTFENDIFQKKKEFELPEENLYYLTIEIFENDEIQDYFQSEERESEKKISSENNKKLYAIYTFGEKFLHVFILNEDSFNEKEIVSSPITSKGFSSFPPKLPPFLQTLYLEQKKSQNENEIKENNKLMFYDKKDDEEFLKRLEETKISENKNEETNEIENKGEKNEIGENEEKIQNKTNHALENLENENKLRVDIEEQLKDNKIIKKNSEKSIENVLNNTHSSDNQTMVQTKTEKRKNKKKAKADKSKEIKKQQYKIIQKPNNINHSNNNVNSSNSIFNNANNMNLSAPINTNLNTNFNNLNANLVSNINTNQNNNFPSFYSNPNIFMPPSIPIPLDLIVTTKLTEIEQNLYNTLSKLDNNERSKIDLYIFTNELKKIFGEQFTAKISPSIEKFLLKLYDQINTNYEKGVSFYKEKITFEEEKNKNIQETLQECINVFKIAFSTMQENTNEMKKNFHQMESLVWEKEEKINLLVDKMNDVLQRQEELEKKLAILERSNDENYIPNPTQFWPNFPSKNDVSGNDYNIFAKK